MVYPLFSTMARTGLRLGEALALQWKDLHFHGREIRVAPGSSRGRIDTPKSRHGRMVDMSQQLAGTVLRLQIERKDRDAAPRVACPPAMGLLHEANTPLDTTNADKAFKRISRPTTLAVFRDARGR